MKVVHTHSSSTQSSGAAMFSTPSQSTHISPGRASAVHAASINCVRPIQLRARIITAPKYSVIPKQIKYVGSGSNNSTCTASSSI